MLKVDNYYQFFAIIILFHSKVIGKDITFEKLTFGGDKLNKSSLARQYGETIERRLNPDKYKREKKIRIL